MTDKKKTCNHVHFGDTAKAGDPGIKSCNNPLYDDDYCIFHSKQKKKKEFKERFKIEFERQKNEENEYDFNEFVFPDDIAFGGYQFDEKDVSFKGATFLGKADFSWAKFLKKVDFENAAFSGEADFEDSEFSGSALYGLFDSLKNKGLSRLKGRFKIKNFLFTINEEIAKQYPVIDRLIKDEWYLKDYKTNYPIIYRIWNITAKCGQSILRWSIWSFGIAIVFAMVFWLATPFFEFTNPSFSKELVTDFWSYLYFSFVTFTTLGFGDIVALNWCSKLIVTLEVIVGYIMLGGLVSILANKLARRS